jgi:hypothetical protein
VTPTTRLAGALIAGLFLALHLPFLPRSLEDLDSINFALGVRDFDVSRHQPHPPGYPLFILAAKIVHASGLSEVRALSLLSVVAGAVAVFGLLTLFRELDRDRPEGPFTWVAVLLAVVCPLYWITAARPLSDVAGLAAALGAQALIVTATGVAPLALAALAAGFAAGVRSQVVWLTLPLLFVQAVRLPRAVRSRAIAAAIAGYGVGALLWIVPLMWISGGASAYWRAFFNQGAEDLTGVAMLATRPTIRQLVQALQYAFVWPWGYWQTSALVLVVALVGLVQTSRKAPKTLVLLLVAFGPYLVFDLLFQETITTRYALPLVVPVTYLAVRGISTIPSTPAMGVALGLAALCVIADDRALHSYARMDAPAFRMLGDMDTAAAAPESSPARVLAMHRREEFDMRRPMQWVGDMLPRFKNRLPSTAKHEWLELVRYWNGGGRDPVWFMADPLRSDLALVRSRRRPVRYRWDLEPAVLIGGVRPNELDWYTFDTPDWYLGEGWSLTPETAGIAREDRRGPGLGPISGWIKRWSGPVTLMVGGRNLGVGGTAAGVTIAVDGEVKDELSAPPGFFLRTIPVPSIAGEGDYATVTIQADSPDVAIEQFDAQPAGRVMYGFGEGWHELEYTPSTGALWRWTSDRAVLRVRAEGHAVALTLRGEIEAASTSKVVIRAADRVVAEFDAGRTFSRTVIIPAQAVASPDTPVTIETSASYVPADTSWRSKDRRRLGLKLFECQITPAS